MPYFWLVSIANSRHGSVTGQRWHTALARASRACFSSSDSPSSPKKRTLSYSLQAARSCQSSWSEESVKDRTDPSFYWLPPQCGEAACLVTRGERVTPSIAGRSIT